MKSLLLLYIAIDWNKTSVWVAIIALALGLIGIVFKAGGIKKTIDIVENDVGDIKKDLKDILIRFGITESRVNDLWATKLTSESSPKYLNKFGLKILKESNVEVLIN